ncbi:MAG: 50S ribosomal protein L25/general stress protein Ctc [Limnobacter sp.]|nr:50S ribosomal protein L25/general stress protein Ctc [Limnobacter sp.]
MKIVAKTRTQQGSGASRRLRREGLVPGIVYGATAKPQSFTTNHNDLWHSIQKEKFHSSIIELEIDGKVEPVLLRTYQSHPYKAQVLHIDFQRVDPKVPVRVKVPLHFSGHLESEAVKKLGGLATFVANQLEVECMADKLPEFIHVNCSGLSATKRSIHVSDLDLPEGVAIPQHGQHDLSVVTVKIKNASAKLADEQA